MLLCVGSAKLNLLEVTSLNAFIVLVKHLHMGSSSRLGHRVLNGQNMSRGLSVKLRLGRHGEGGCGHGSVCSL